MERYFFGLLGLIFSGSIGALFLYVHLWSILAVALVLIGLIVMFVLGVHVGSNAKSDGSADLDDHGFVETGVGSFEGR